MDRRQYLSGLVAASGLAVTGVSTASAQSDAIASWDDPEGDDAGPGSYTYPGTDEITEGQFDLASFTVRPSDDRYVFEFGFHNELSNPWGGDNGYSHQTVHVYVRDPSSDGGTTTARAGVNAELASPYHHRVVATPFSGDLSPRVEDAEGELASEDVVIEKPDASTISVSVPQSSIDYLESGHLVPVVLSHDGESGNLIRGIEQEAGDWTFGGAENGNAPAVIDLVTPEGVDQSDALSYSEDSVASIPYLAVSGDAPSAGDGSSDDGGSSDDSSDDGSSDDSSSDDGGRSEDDGSSDDSESEDDSSSEGDGSDDGGSSDGGSDDEDSGLPGFGVGAGLAGIAGGALAARRRGDDETDDA